MEGMDEMEFTEADSYMTDLIDNYSGHHGEVGSDEDEDEDVDENMSIESEDEF